MTASCRTAHLLLLLSVCALARGDDAVVPNGRYRMVNKHSGKAAGVAGASLVAGDASDGASQHWVFTVSGQGYYKIENVRAARVIDTSATPDDAVGVADWVYPAEDGQLFTVKDEGGGHASIHSKLTGKALEGSKSGAGVKQGAYLGANSQLWKLFRVPPSPGSGFQVADGVYFLVNRWSGMHIEVKDGSKESSALVHLAEKTYFPQQQWHFTNLGGGFCKIENVNSGLGFDVAGASEDNGVDVVQWPYSGEKNQQFAVKDAGDGYVSIHPKHTGKAVELDGWGGTDVMQWEYTVDANQQWILVPVTASTNRQPPTSGLPALFYFALLTAIFVYVVRAFKSRRAKHKKHAERFSESRAKNAVFL
ncbi:hypothetical protein DIPPA_14537 [Diplonema papillatum]|nr:hypothetical protein DIPPA_14537 [Diplonema papillatum]